MKKLPKISLRSKKALFISTLIPLILLAASSKASTYYMAFSYQPTQQLLRNSRIPNLEPIANPSLQVTSSPLATFSITPTPTSYPTTKLTPTPPPSFKPTPTIVGTSPMSPQNYILNQINVFRHSKGLSLVQADSLSCEFASLRAHEILSGFNHDGFNNRARANNLPYPSYHQATENIAQSENFQEVETMWANSPSHAANLLADTPFMCIAQQGEYFALEGYKP